MRSYQGVTQNDIPKGAGWYVTKNKTGGEVYNFKVDDGKYFGYVRIQNDRGINLKRLGGTKSQESIQNVTVVFFATNPQYRRQYIVGWYSNATLFRKLQNRAGDPKQYFAYCDSNDAILIPVEKRIYEVDGPGETNIWYPRNPKKERDLSKLFQYLNSQDSSETRTKINNSRSWQADVQQRKEIELSAMNAVADYFENNGFKIIDVHNENKGWDLEAKKGKIKFNLEVKGTKSDEISIDVTPNEYRNIKSNSKVFRLCIVSNALIDSNRKIEIFYYDDESQEWINESNSHLIVKELVSARITIS